MRAWVLSASAVMLAMIFFWASPGVARERNPWENDLIVELQAAPLPAGALEQLSRELEGANKFSRLFGLKHTLVVSANTPQVRERIEAALKQSPFVASVQRNYVYRASFVPNDPLFSRQWNFTKVHAEEAWDLDATPPLYGGDSSVTVAVLDSGFAPGPDFDLLHQAAGYDFVNSDADPKDDNGHGTHVTGTIAESTNNGTVAAGLAFESTVMPVKVLDASGTGSTAAITQGINYAVQHSAKVINLSLGGGDDDPLLHTAIINARKAGVVLVAATGNEAANSLSYPAQYDEAIAVGAVRYDDTRAPYANIGTGIDLVAPGGDLSVDQNGDGQPDGVVQQTCTTGACTSFDAYLYVGTSQAAPHVSAAAALLFAAGADGSQIPLTLTSTARDLGDPGYDTTYGYGLVDIAAAIRSVVQDSTPPTGSVFINADAASTKDTAVTLTLSATDASGVASMQLSNDGVTYSPPEAFAETKSWDLADASTGGTATDGAHTVSMKLTDVKGNVSAPFSDDIVLDRTAPTNIVITGYTTLARKRSFQSNEPVTVEKPYFVMRAEDPSGVDGYFVDWSTKATSTSRGTFQLENSFAPPKVKLGVSYLHVRGVDKNGNVSDPVTFIFRRGSGFVAASSQGVDVRVLNGKDTSPARRFSVAGGTKGLSLAHGDLNGDGRQEVVAAPLKGKAKVSILSYSGKVLRSFLAFPAGFRGGAAVALGDLNGDGVVEIIAVPAKGAAQVSIFSPTGEVVRRFFAFDSSYRGGATVAVGDTNGDGVDEVAVATSQGLPTLRMFDGQGTLLQTVKPYGSTSKGGLTVAAGDVDADGLDDWVITQVTGPCQVKVLSGDGKRKNAFKPSTTIVNGSCRASAGDVDSDGRDELILSGTSTEQPLRVFEANGKYLPTFRYPKFPGAVTTFLPE